jgi:UDP-N-acetylglucosamine 2-epimerase (non-hydrolysing)
LNQGLLAVVGARPNFVKVAPVLHALSERDVRPRVLHTGQHYDHFLSAAFLDQLDFPTVEFALGVGSGSHAQQTAAVMVGVERVLEEHRELHTVLVAGDVNSTMAAAIAAAKARVRLIHIESGLRSGDWDMPEEVNRVVTDRVSDLLLCHSKEAVDNLGSEGVPSERVRLVGNTMIDSLFRLLPVARRTGAVRRLGLEDGQYVLVTLHRPAVVDDVERFGAVLEVLGRLAERLPVVMPLHPRTRSRLEDHHSTATRSVRTWDALEYLDFLDLEASARLVITDSGGVQEETSALGVPCVTYRTTTERAVTITHGTNRLAGVDPAGLERACDELLATPRPTSAPLLPHWDGHAGVRAADAIVETMRAWSRGEGGRPSSSVG